MAPANEGWVHLKEKPKIVTDLEGRVSGHYFEWFERNNKEYLRCQRLYKSAGCGESIRVYSQQDGSRIDEMEIHLVCLKH